MQMKAQYLLIAILLLATACKKKKTASQASGNIQGMEQETPTSIKGKVYYGKIDYKYPIILNLWEEDSIMKGVYYYEKIGKDLSLEGIKEDGEIHLKEFDNTNAQTASWNIGRGESENTMFGKWFSADGERELAIDLMEVDIRAWKNELNSPWNGSWTDGFETLDIKMLTETQAFFYLFAFNGRNMGELQGIIEIEENKAVYEDSFFGESEEDMCRITFDFQIDSILVSQKQGSECGAGMGITFDGNLASQEVYDQHWESIPMEERIGKGHLWQHYDDDHYEYLHLKADHTYVVSVESRNPYEIHGSWELDKNKQTLILTQNPSGNVSEWEISEVSKLFLNLKMDDMVKEYTSFGYED